MAPRTRARRLAGAVLALAAAVTAAVTAAGAHDFSILPSDGKAAPDQPFDLSMHVGVVFPGDEVAWRTGHVVELAIVDARGRRDIETPEIAGDPGKARLSLRIPGTAVVALATDASYITLEAEKFDAYLDEEGHHAAIEARRKGLAPRGEGRERYTRHVKTILNPGGPSASVALTRVGLALEIVPEKSLTALHPGGKIPVRVFFKGEPVPGGRLCATDAGQPGDDAHPYAWCGTLDGAGRIDAPIGARGWEMLRITKMIPIYDDPKADWHSFWASLTFPVDDQAQGTTR
ncbi:MAG TPA: DUF4198 domain-containing protein [Candidatus Polarisedimenticolia bacterium]|nr:DUF4198 domain-containing protein [Candidatus Polarisedimenticolia bacterium]